MGRRKLIMITQVRIFNNDGIDRFREYIEQIQNSQKDIGHLDWIHEEYYSKAASPEIFLATPTLESKLAAIKTLYPIIDGIQLPDKFYHQGLWSWLSAYYFASLCLLDKKGNKKPGKEYRYIPPSNRNWRTIYRHLLAGPIRLSGIHKTDIKILFHAPVNKIGDFMEQLASRQEIAASRGILKAADILYWDKDKNKAKPGARATGNKPGSLRRYVSILQQFMLTYDLYTLDAEKILELLPKNEFEHWF